MGAFVVTMREGYIRIHRSLLDWEWYDDESVKVLFLHLLLSVNWKHGRWKGIDVEPGSMVCSIEGLAQSLGWTRAKLRNALDKLKRTGEVTTTTTNHWTAVSLVNWAKYQLHEQQNSQPRSHPTANQQLTDSHPTATIEEGNKERREEKSVTRSRPRTIEWFKAECRKVVDSDPTLMAASEHKPFFDYWTEQSTNGKMRFEGEKYFDVRRRMMTWSKRSKQTTFTASKTDDFAERQRVRKMIEEKYGIEPGGRIGKEHCPQEHWVLMGFDKMI
jgi:hypothetical protein